MDITKIRSDKVNEGRIQDAQKSKSTEKAESIEIGSSKPTATSKTAEKVSFSPEAGMLLEGLHDAKTASDVRADRVAELKAQIKGGHYKVDAKAVAEKMLQAGLEEEAAVRKS